MTTKKSPLPPNDETVTLTASDGAGDLAELAELAPGGATVPAPELPPEPEPEPAEITVFATYPAQGHPVPVARRTLHKAAELAFFVPSHAEAHAKGGASILVKVTRAGATVAELPYVDGDQFLRAIGEL